MREGDLPLYEQLDGELEAYQDNVRPLPGLDGPRKRGTFIKQLIDSVRRVKYVRIIGTRDVSSERVNPSSDLFDPIRAAIFHQRNGNVDEAFWLTFLSVYFGKSGESEWRLARDVYGALGSFCWSWERISGNPDDFHQWMIDNYDHLREDGVVRKFGNHRKFQSLKPICSTGTSNAFRSYVEWVGPEVSHEALISRSIDAATNDPRELFGYLYASLASVKSFGRLAKFDFLTLVGKLGLAQIEPDSGYIAQSTGPDVGTRLLFGGSKNYAMSGRTMDNLVIELERNLSVGNFGLQVMEDAICNWQKNPARYLYFGG